MQTRGETSFRDGLLLEIKTAGLLFEISYANSWEGGGASFRDGLLLKIKTAVLVFEVLNYNGKVLCIWKTAILQVVTESSGTSE